MISGGRFEQFKLQIIDRLHVEPHKLNRLHLMPTCGTQYYRYDELAGEWAQQYAENLTGRKAIKRVRSLNTRKGRASGVEFLLKGELP